MKKLLTILCLVLLSSYSYSQDLPLDGPYETFYENGQLEVRGNYKDGIEHGFQELFYKNGQLHLKGTWKNGVGFVSDIGWHFLPTGWHTCSKICVVFLILDFKFCCLENMKNYTYLANDGILWAIR